MSTGFMVLMVLWNSHYLNTCSYYHTKHPLQAFFISVFIFRIINSSCIQRILKNAMLSLICHKCWNFTLFPPLGLGLALVTQWYFSKSSVPPNVIHNLTLQNYLQQNVELLNKNKIRHCLFIFKLCFQCHIRWNHVSCPDLVRCRNWFSSGNCKLDIILT